MPILQRIEISNFLNSGRHIPWRPDWPHQIFELHGENAALNIPNGKGKSTLFMAILAMLLHDKEMRNLRQKFFAPKSTGHFTHIRIQVQIPMPGASEDLVTLLGGEIGGNPMVFGVYGYSGENEDFSLYAYQGTFEDCPVASVHTMRHTLVRDDDFLSELKGKPGLFPVNAKERTKRAWIAYVDDYFDMSSIKQQFVYQQLKGAEGGHGYFDVTPSTGMNYSAAVFYQRLAPELLTEVMGDLGEENEHGIEDTIHEKVSRVITAKHATAQKAAELRRARNTLNELQGLLDSSARLAAVKQQYDKHLQAYSIELAVLQDVLVDAPIPGVPKTPPDHMPALARQMVMQGGQWFLPDRVMAEFTNEPASEVNRRAHDRNGIATTQAHKSQLIDFACHLAPLPTRKGGHSNQLYSRDAALALLKITSNFARHWTRENATKAVVTAFDWVEAHSDTNPARKLALATSQKLKEAENEFKRLSEQYLTYQREKENLLTEQRTVSEQQSEYRRLVDSGLFTSEELADPATTGEQVARQYQAASDTLDAHAERRNRHEEIYKAWQAYLAEYGPKDPPGERADRLMSAEKTAKTNLDARRQALKTARGQDANLEAAQKTSEKRLEQAKDRHERYTLNLPALERYREVFGNESPENQASLVTKALTAAKNRQTAVEVEMISMAPFLDALAVFHDAHGEVAPSDWLKDRSTTWDELGRQIQQSREALKEAKIRREALDKTVIVGGKVTREAAGVAGGRFRLVHEVITALSLPDEARERALSLLSAMLHAPVYETVQEAGEAARKLAEQDIEAPVFVRDELEVFCSSGRIEMDAGIAHAWLVGIRTRQVECLLDPTLVEREKELADARIEYLGTQISALETERSAYDPEGNLATRARKAQEAIDNQYPSKQNSLAGERNELLVNMPELERRAGAAQDIQVVVQHRKEFGALTEQDILDALEHARVTNEQAVEARAQHETTIEDLETAVGHLEIQWQEAAGAVNQVERLRNIQVFIDHPENNPAFMEAAEDIGIALKLAKDQAGARTPYRFDQAAQFLRAGYDRPKAIELRLQHIKEEQDHIQITALPGLTTEKDRLYQHEQDYKTDAGEIDRFFIELLHKYRDFAADRSDAITITREQIEWHALGGFAPSLREAPTLEEQRRLLLDIANDFEMEEASGLRHKMKEARTGLQATRENHATLVDKALAAADMDMSDHVRMELQRAKEQPSIIDHLHAVAWDNFTKNEAANTIASEHLDKEWGTVGDWLEKFTKRLPDNLKTMKRIFGPKTIKTADGQEEFVSAGFVVEATTLEQQDIRSVLDDIVTLVEKFEQTRSAMSNLSSNLRDSAIRGLREQIRTSFYEKVIQQPRIKVYMPSISPRALPLEKGMVSTGQGVAMTLLWIVKMADYITERERRRLTTSRAQLKHLQPTQFALMDGAFSSLSNKGLIKDALDSIKGSRGRFQLIVSGHDENYRNNFEYFPVLIEAREINGQFMYADSKTRRVLEPEDVGSHYGALSTIGMRVLPIEETDVRH